MGYTIFRLAMRLYAVSLLSIVFAPLCLSQTPQKAASCHVNTVQESPAQIKNDRFEFKEAAALFVAELKENPKNSTLRAGQIRNLADNQQLEEADTLATAFVVEDPSSGTALTAKAYVLYAQGKLAESYATNAASQKLDPCQARTYLYLSDYERSIANWKSAWDHIQLAHKLDPLSDDILKGWIDFLPYRDALEARKARALTTPVLTEEQRNRIVGAVDKALATPPKPLGCRPGTAAAGTSVKLSEQALAPGVVVTTIPMSINGKTKHLILDTGASGIMLTAVAASNLGLTAEQRGYVGGFGDDKLTSVKSTHLKSVHIGDVEFTNCEALVTSGVGGFADGIVGGDVFHEFLLSLDLSHGLITLDSLPQRPDKLPNPSSILYSDAGDVDEAGTVHYRNRYIDSSMTGWTPFYLIETKLLLPTQINTSAPSLFMIDTGSDFTLAQTGTVKPFTKLQESSDDLVGFSGRVKNTYRTGPLVLHFAGLYQPMSSMIALDTIPSTLSTTVGGILGLPTWRQVVLRLDYRDHLMKVEIPPKK
jgi:hypothetical protein